MSAIAYITDSKMLELHRLNKHRTISFWRLSVNNNFSDFGPGDLVFFLSKDKIHRKGQEKGIVGLGRLETSTAASPKTMWKRYGIYNGYKTYSDFKEALCKVTRDHELPEKISAFYLKNVAFFQPVYLSECGMKISSSIESYIYLKPREVVLRLLDLAEDSGDFWSLDPENTAIIEEEKIRYVLKESQEKLQDLPLISPRKVRKTMKEALEKDPQLSYVPGSLNTLYKIEGDRLSIVFYHDKDSDDKALVGQAQLFRYHFYRSGLSEVVLRFRTTDNDRELDRYLDL